MNERKFNEVFAERLKYYMDKYDITQVELARRLGVGTTSVYNWLYAIKTPRMDKIDAMCEMFHCNRSDLTEDKSRRMAQTRIKSWFHGAGSGKKCPISAPYLPHVDFIILYGNDKRPPAGAEGLSRRNYEKRKWVNVI